MLAVYIGSLKINNPVVVAPMAGVTDYPFRRILREMGCELLYTEMISAKGLVYGSRRTRKLLELTKGGLSGVQLSGSEHKTMAKAAKRVENDFKPELIDITFGCQATKIVNNGSGSALMKKPKLLGDIVASVSGAVELPVTVKMRKGWDKDIVNAVEIAQIAVENGAAAVAVHGRTREQFYSGEADREIIREVKNKVSVPVIGNGDIFEPEDAKKMFKSTNCDMVMLARGIRGNPWLYSQVVEYINKDEVSTKINFDEIIEMAIYHLQLAVNYYSEEVAVPRMRKHINWYLKGLPYATDIKDRVNKIKQKSEVKKVLRQYLKEIKN